MGDEQLIVPTRLSVKKTIGAIGSVCLYAIGLFAVWQDPSQASNILWPLGAYTAALFGIKKFGPIGKTP